MKFYYCVRSLERVPSCTYNIRMLKDMGHEVVVVSGEVSEALTEMLENSDVQIIYGLLKQNGNNIKDKVNITLSYRRCLKKALKHEKKEAYIIFGTADSAIHAFGMGRKFKNILCLKELYDVSGKLYKFLIGCAAKRAEGIICCEKNRSRIIQWRYKLKNLPYTLANKPYGYPTEKALPQTEQTKKIINEINGRNFVLYQSRYVGYKYELVNLARAMNELNTDTLLVIVGSVTDKTIEKKINDIYPNIIWTGHIPAPHHMEITGYAKIGIAVYAEDRLNNLFCAPNKTYEYAGFGIPSLCNDIPGLEESVGLAHAGKCVNWNDISEIAGAIEEMLDNYEEYSANARKFYNDEDSPMKLKMIIEDIIGENK